MCDARPSVERDGKSYCWRHDPVRLKKEATERWESRKKQIEDGDARFERSLRARSALKAILTKVVQHPDFREDWEAFTKEGGSAEGLLDRMRVS